MKRLITIIMLILIVGCTQQPIQKNQQQKIHNENTLDSFPVEDISASEIDALNLALNDEYKARATYKKVLEKFGEVKPFSNIINAETTHTNALIEIYNKYNLDVPTDTWYDKVDSYDSVSEACAVGVQAEIENADLYDQLFSKVDNQDIISVFTSLRDASRDNHLPAFERCKR